MQRVSRSPSREEAGMPSQLDRESRCGDAALTDIYTMVLELYRLCLFYSTFATR